MTTKKKKLPNTIKLTRTRAGVPRSYTEDQVKEIASHLGPLPAGKISYPGAFPPFHILGEEHPEMRGMFQAYLQRDDHVKMTRQLTLLGCLETAAWMYKKNKPENGKKSDTPSQRLKALARLEKACDVLADGGGLFDSLGLWWRLPALEEDVQKVLVPLKNEIEYQTKYFSQQKAPGKSHHKRDADLHNFVAELCVIWVHVAGRKLTSGSVSPDGKDAGGPLIRFIQAALMPLGIDKTPNAIRALLRAVGSNQKYKNLI